MNHHHAAIAHILLPFDFSPQGASIAPFVRTLAMRFDARVTVLSVVPPTWQLPPEGMRPLAGDSPHEWVDALRQRLEPALRDELSGVRVDRVADGGDPALRIAAYARDHQVDLIAMPTHGLGTFRRFLVGSVTSKVLHDASCPVWTAAHVDAPTPPRLPRQVLCAVDATPASTALLQWADAFCRAIDARLGVVHAVGPITDWPSNEHERQLQEQVRRGAHERLESMQAAAGLTLPLRVRVGEIVDTVVDEAVQAQADLVIIGRGSIGEPFGRLRTHAFGIVQRSPCPVLSV